MMLFFKTMPSSYFLQNEYIFSGVLQNHESDIKIAIGTSTTEVTIPFEGGNASGCFNFSFFFSSLQLFWLCFWMPQCTLDAAVTTSICYYTYIDRESAKYCISSTEKTYKIQGAIEVFLKFLDLKEFGMIFIIFLESNEMHRILWNAMKSIESYGMQ